MNPTISADALVAAALWLLALGLPLAMLLWMAAQYVALRALGRRIAALEARPGAAPAVDHGAPSAAVPPAPDAAPPTATDGAPARAVDAAVDATGDTSVAHSVDGAGDDADEVAP